MWCFEVSLLGYNYQPLITTDTPPDKRLPQGYNYQPGIYSCSPVRPFDPPTHWDTSCLINTFALYIQLILICSYLRILILQNFDIPHKIGSYLYKCFKCLTKG